MTTSLAPGTETLRFCCAKLFHGELFEASGIATAQFRALSVLGLGGLMRHVGLVQVLSNLFGHIVLGVVLEEKRVIGVVLGFPH